MEAQGDGGRAPTARATRAESARRVAHLEADREQLSRFITALFAYAGEGVVSLRGFPDDKRDGPPTIRPVSLNGIGFGPLIDAAVEEATKAARSRRPMVFAPPIALFAGEKADEASLVEGLALSLELDERPAGSLITMRAMLGPPTLVVASGGTWIDPATGEVHDKLHGHWRLKEPTASPGEHARLKRARSLACGLVGADPTAKSAVHPMRWAGSVHRKDPARPRLCRIVEENPAAEIALEDALAELEGLAALRGEASGNRKPGAEPTADDRLVTACLERLANPLPPNPDTPTGKPREHWDDWNRIGMAAFRASAGSEAAFDAFDKFSARYGAKYDPAATRARWEHYRTSPPGKVGIGSLVREARLCDPGFRPRREEPPPEEEPTGSTPPAGPEPLDLFAEHLSAPASLDERCLPRIILDFARSEGARLGVDPVGIAGTALAVCSGVLSDDWAVCLKVQDTGWVEHARLWVAVVARPGEMKTEQYRIAARPIRRLEAELHQAHTAAAEKYREEHAAWKKLPKKERDGKPEPAAPVASRLSSSDFTIEAVADLLKNASKVILNNDELSTFIGAFDRYQQGGKVSASRGHALSLYDGGGRHVDRVKGSVYVKNWSAVVFGGIQLEKLRPIVADLATDGLLQRFATLVPGQVQPADEEDDDRPPDEAAVNAYDLLVRRLRTLRPAKRDGGGFLTVRAGEDAKEPRRRVFRLARRIMADPTLPAPLRETASKWRGLVARLALLFHCIGLAEKTTQTAPTPRAKWVENHAADVVTLASSTVDMAANFVLRVVAPSAFALYRELGLTGDQHARWIAGHILAKGAEHISAWEIGRVYRELRGDTPGIAHAMELLEHAGWVTGDEHPKRPKWDVDPRVHTLFKARAESERESRRRTQELIRTSIDELAR